MSYQATFKRYEIKYLLNSRQKDAVLQAMQPYMELDGYGRTTIRNIYFDTDSYRLIRRSLEKPVYKEKLRLRSYGVCRPGDAVFLELKKKYQDVVYKRRVNLREAEAMDCLASKEPLPDSSQISREIDYFRSFYQELSPTVVLSYQREAYCLAGDPGLRITFDEAILRRDKDFSLCSRVYGIPVLAPGQVLMEVKATGSIPFELARLFSENGIFKTSFSKYGAAYQQMIKETGGIRYA